jgi:voltage-gated potassium channel
MKSRVQTDQNLLAELHARLRFWLLVLLTIAGAGVVGFRVIEHCSWLEAIYRTISVLATLGLPSYPPNNFAIAFVIILSICGISSVAYAASAVVRLMVSDEFHRASEQRKVTQRMKNLSNHCILCGYGRIGEIVSKQLQTQGIPFVIIDRDDEIVNRLEDEGILATRGDASHEETLERAGLARARSVIVVTSSDAENLLITMTARQFNPEVPIIVRCDEETNSPKLARVGATRVITLNTTGAAQMALAATKPYVIDLIDLATGTGRQEFQMRQIMVPDGSPAHEQTLINLALGSRFGVIVIGIKSRGQEMQFNPSADTCLSTGDTLVTVGREEKFRELEAFLGR